MSSFDYPSRGGKVPTYANIAAFPATSTNGALGVALDTGYLYEYRTGSSSWVVIGGPEVALAIGDITLAVPSANGASLSNNQLFMQYASATTNGLVSTAAQTLAGAKTFSTAPILSSLTASQALVLDGSKNIATLGYASANTVTTLVERDGSGNFSAGTITASLTGHASLDVATSSLGTVTEATSSVLTLTGWTTATVGSPTIQVKLAATAQSGYLSSTDWNTFNGKGSVSSVALSVPATSILGVTGSPVTTSGTLGLTTTGTSGGIPYFSSTSQLTSSALLTNNALLLGGGAGASPAALGSLGTTTTVLHGNAAGGPTFGAVSLTADVSGILPIANGGTNANTKASAFDSLSPMSASGDIIYGAASGTGTRLAKGADTNVLTLVSGLPAWSAASTGTVTSVALSVPATSILGVTGSPVTTSGTLGLTTTGTSGGIPYFSSTSQLASSALLTANALVLGGGAGTTPTVLGSLGTTTQVLHGNAGGAPSFAAIALADLPLKQVVVGTAQTSNGTTTSATYAAFGSNNPTVSITPTVSGTYKVFGNFTAFNSVSGQTIKMKLKDTAGSPTVVFTQTVTQNQNVTNGDQQYSPYMIVTLTASTLYTFELEAQTSSGTLNLDSASVAGGHAIVVFPLT